MSWLEGIIGGALGYGAARLIDDYRREREARDRRIQSFNDALDKIHKETSEMDGGTYYSEEFIEAECRRLGIQDDEQ